MKKGYLLLALFGLWCLVCALWYVSGVMGASKDLALFSPQPMVLAIVEILVMVLGAFIMGFGAAWMNRQPSLDALQGSLADTKAKLGDKERDIAVAHTNAEVAAGRIRQAEEKIIALLQDNDKRMKDIEREAKKATDLEKKIEDVERKVADLESKVAEEEAKSRTFDGEASSARFRVRLLENELADRDAVIQTLKEEVEELKTKPRVEHRDWSDHPFVRPPEQEGDTEVDDLTSIKGIGPVFQRKLNALDIFSFRQIAEMSGDAVQRLAEAIQVFPDRIHRDNWIGQATRLYKYKIGEGD